jgi:hypothetical protein
VRTIDAQERRARLGARHGLAASGPTVEAATEALVALHSSDPSSVFLAARARVKGFAPADLEASLYERRSLVRMHGMRRTLFVVDRDIAASMDAACTAPLVPAQRRRLLRILTDQGVTDDPEPWLARVETATLQALAERGEASAVELTKDVPDLGRKLRFDEESTWATTVGVSTRVLFLLATEGRIVRARPLGGWTSGQYRWATVERWLGGPLPRRDPSEAASELLERWLRAFGPGTLVDIRWWTGWTAARSRAALDAVGALEVALDEGVGYVLPDDEMRAAPVEPWVALLPSLDPTVMGWKERDWYLGEHRTALFDRNGNAGATVWVDGRVVGGWAQLADGSIVTELLEPLDRRRRAAVDAEAARLAEWFGDVRATPRFRTPLERRLRG